MTNTRCKAICSSKTETKGTVYDESGKNSKEGTVYTYSFYAVMGDGAPENKKFFAATPSLSLSLSCVREDTFEVGQAYYLDLIPAQRSL